MFEKNKVTYNNLYNEKKIIILIHFHFLFLFVIEAYESPTIQWKIQNMMWKYNLKC
jgi:hypothetical protein